MTAKKEYKKHLKDEAFDYSEIGLNLISMVINEYSNREDSLSDIVCPAPYNWEQWA